MKKRRMNIVISEEIYEKVRKYCFEKRISMSKFIESSIKNKLEDYLYGFEIQKNMVREE